MTSDTTQGASFPPEPARTPEPPYYAVVFTSTRPPAPDDGYTDGYAEAATHLAELATGRPGFLGMDSARGSDGFGITVSYWEDEASLAAWREDAVHAAAREEGRRRWYETYAVHVATVGRAYRSSALREPSPARVDLRDAARGFAELVRQVPDDAWDRPALGSWTVRDLVGHTARALVTIEDYLAAGPSGPATLPDAVAYFRAGVGIANSEAVAARGREAGAELGPDPAGAVEALVDRVLALVDGAEDDVVLGTRLGALRLADYLPTRSFELTVHGLDLHAALGDAVRWTPPPGPVARAAHLTTDLALAQDLGPALLRTLTGRGPLPDGICVL